MLPGLHQSRPRLSRAAHAAGQKVWCTPAPFDDRVCSLPLQLVDTLVVNRSEAAGLTELPLESLAGSLLDQLCRRWPQARMILTLGGAGALAREPGGSLLVSPASPAQVVDTTAAGDTFIGYCLARHLAGDDLRDALAIASRAAAACVSRPGAIPAIPRAQEFGL